MFALLKFHKFSGIYAIMNDLERAMGKQNDLGYAMVL
jgi:hypothetical protein